MPVDTRVYAIGDIHGRLDMLQGLHRVIRADAASSSAGQRVIVYLGDYVDRGPKPRQVVDYLINEPLSGFAAVHLMGNHEAFLLQFLDDSHSLSSWLMNGGEETLASYGVDCHARLRGSAREDWLRDQFLDRLPSEHRSFYCGLKLSHVEGDYCFVHAGVRPGVPIEQQDPFDLIWIREPFLSSSQDFGKIVVHGHTPVSRPVCQPNKIGIDTGAVYGGTLTALVLENDSQSFLQV